MTKLNSDKLIKFENKIANLFNLAKIRSPVHLHSGNEKNLIRIFKKIKKQDWIFCSWRSHYHCLLKGVPEKDVLSDICKGKSISLCFPKYNIYSSAIVGGSIPIALGVAFSIKKKKTKQKVYCFVGDMTSETGIMAEVVKYSKNHKLPIHFVVEDNSLSVCTDTKKTWKMKKISFQKNNKYVSYYKYKLKYPHAGAGVRVEF